MSRLDSDYDYFDLPRIQVPCETKGCEEFVTFPDFEVFCSRCLLKHRESVGRQQQEKLQRRVS